MIYILNGEELHGQFKTEDGTTYPSNWLELSTEDEKSNIGIISLSEIFPDPGEGAVYDGYVDDYEAGTRTYSKITP